MFSRYANGVRAINGSPAFAPTPMALGLNVKRLTHGRVRYSHRCRHNERDRASVVPNAPQNGATPVTDRATVRKPRAVRRRGTRPSPAVAEANPADRATTDESV